MFLLGNTRLAALFLLSGAACASTITFTTGMDVPESITPIPGTFGGLSGYLVPDPTGSTVTDAPSTIWQVSTTGQLSVFSTSAQSLRDGIFLPDNFGSYGGDYAVAGLNGNAVVGIDPTNLDGGVTIYDPEGNATAFVTGLPAEGLAIAPDGFGAEGGDLLVSYSEPGQAGIAVFDPTGNRLPDLMTEDVFAPYYQAFAPAGFGGFSGDLFTTDDRQPYIYTVGTDGSLSLFATVPQGDSTRFIGFAPAGFGAWAGDLIVGVPGSSLGANDGFLYVYDANGNPIAQLSGVNPRGFTFINGGTQMLLNITDPGVLLANPADFTQVVPEPGTLVMAALGLGLGIWKLRRR